MSKRAKGIGLISGGLDSVLSFALLQSQGVEVIGVLVKNGFTDHMKPSANGRTVQDIADEMGFSLRIVDISDSYWETLFYPKHGYGKNMNPCLDCHIRMLQVAADVMKQENADFVFTGEVMGQRPKSQLAHQMKTALRESGLEGRLLRPLSAGRLEPTIVEQNGLVNRSRLMDFTGRKRSPQLNLAKELGVKHLTVAAGGNCFLTNKEFTDKFQDLLTQYGKENFPKKEVSLLRLGRHFRLSASAKLVLSRNKDDHSAMTYYSEGHSVFEHLDIIGAYGLGLGEFSQQDLHTAAKLMSRYSKAKAGSEINVKFTAGNKTEIIPVTVIDDNDAMIERLRI